MPTQELDTLIQRKNKKGETEIHYPVTLIGNVIDPATGETLGEKLAGGELKGETYEWLTGSGVPANATGKQGDMYINTATADVYKKTSATAWTLQINIKGATGATGAAGGTGATGAAGATYDWLTGTTDPATGTGKVGDMYLNTTSCDVFKKTAATTWTKQCNIKGATGATGATGGTGAAGGTGATGAAGTLMFPVTAATSTAPTGARVGDLILNAGTAALTIAGVSAAIGDLVKITTLSPLAGTASGNIRGAMGAAGLQGAGFSELDDIQICAGNFKNAAAGWCSFTFPREFDGVPAVNIQPINAEGIVQINNVTTRGFQYQVRVPATAAYFTADAAAATSAHTSRTLMTGFTTTTAAVDLSYIAVFDGDVDN